MKKEKKKAAETLLALITLPTRDSGEKIPKDGGFFRSLFNGPQEFNIEGRKMTIIPEGGKLAEQVFRFVFTDEGGKKTERHIPAQRPYRPDQACFRRF